METLVCQNVTKEYGTDESYVRALDGASFSVERGAFVAILGPSGCGKSTLLHIIGSVEKPTSGSVLVEGEEIAGLSPKAAALYRRRKVGMVYQFFNLVPTLTVQENILLPLELDRRKPDAARLDALMTTLGVADKRVALPSQLSGGQQQRVAIARALLYQPALLLLDEPTGNLDMKNRDELMAMLQETSRTLEQTVLMVTHDESLAQSADRIITMGDGRVLSSKARV